MNIFRFPTQIILAHGISANLPKSLSELKIQKPLLVTDANLVAMDFFNKLIIKH